MSARHEFRKLFKSPGPAVLPVIHVRDQAQTEENVRALLGEGAPGCFLINHDFEAARLTPIVEAVRARWPALWLGVNYLATTGRDAFPTLGALARAGCAVDAYWADDARIDERAERQAEAEEIAEARAASGWGGLYFGGVAFKKQRPVAEADLPAAAREAAGRMDVVTTSGVATGAAAETGKIATFRANLGDAPLAVASGVTPENARAYGAVDAFLVATGINRPGDFYAIDPARLAALLRAAREMGRDGEAGGGGDD